MPTLPEDIRNEVSELLLPVFATDKRTMVTEALQNEPVFSHINWAGSASEFATNLILLLSHHQLVTVLERLADRTGAESAERIKFICARIREREKAGRRVKKSPRRTPKTGMRGGAYPYVDREFLVSDGDIFFGRDQDVKQILCQIKNHSNLGMLAIQGPSGVGKSSLLQAGLLYKLTHTSGKIKNQWQRWVYCLFRPFDPEVISPFRVMADRLPREHGRFDESGPIAQKIQEACQGNSKHLPKIYRRDPFRWPRLTYTRDHGDKSA